MINILFIAQRWYHYNKDQNICWLSDVQHSFYSSLNSTGLGQYKLFEYDYEKEMGSDLDRSLVELCKHNKFDVVMFIGYFEKHAEFQETTWEFLKSNYPIVFFLPDYYPERESYDCHKHGDLIIFSDTDCVPVEEFTPHHYFNFSMPQDPGLYYNADIIRDTEIVFPGSYSPTERTELVKYLWEVGLPLKARGGKINALWGNYHCASPLEYALDHMRAKLAVCLTHEWCQEYVVSHIVESMLCGCCTFINKSDIVRRYFTPDKHYVEYIDKYDLVDKLIYYLDNEEEAQEIAKSGNKEIQKYSAYNFYDKMFTELSKLGLLKYD